MKRVRRLKFKNRTPEHKKSSYFSRYQPKKRRRREGKTDYKLRASLLTQEKNKYNALKYRLVVRRSNRFFIAQLVYYTATGDKIKLSASSEELPRFGLTKGLSSYVGAYCTGLLLASRYSNSMGSSSEESSQDSEEVIVADLGLARVTVGCNVLGAIKGAVDGGMPVPFSDKRSPGSKYDEDEKKWFYDPSVHEKRIFGAAGKLAQEMGPEKARELVENVQKEIRENPFKKDEKTTPRAGVKKLNREKKRLQKVQLKEQRKERRKERRTMGGDGAMVKKIKMVEVIKN